jgi:hypothetical protein
MSLYDFTHLANPFAGIMSMHRLRKGSPCKDGLGLPWAFARGGDRASSGALLCRLAFELRSEVPRRRP